MSFPPVEPRHRPGYDRNEPQAAEQGSRSSAAWILTLAILIAGGALLIWNSSAEMGQTQMTAALTTGSAPAR